MSLRFEILHTSAVSRARVGRIHTPHGIIDTPNFVPVATNATLKAVPSHDLAQLDVPLLFCNTYHLLLHPGPDVIAAAGGLHCFMNRNAPIITDSGGFQIFSLQYGGVTQELKSAGAKSYQNSVLKVSEEGVRFRSYRDGAHIFLTPETSVQTQKALGADIIIPLDELPPYHVDEKTLRNSFDRTHRWQQRSLLEHKRNEAGQAMYGVIHGGINADLRRLSVQLLQKMGFDGYAIGGSVGKNHAEMVAMLQIVMQEVPVQAPVHLLGMGDLPSIAAGVAEGIDTFDSAYPTKCARHGLLLTQEGNIKIEQKRYDKDLKPVDAHCNCITCTNYSRSYLHHLFKAHEAVAHTLASIHNIAFMVDHMKRIREAIMHDKV